MRAVITHCAEGKEEFIRDHIIRVGVGKVILIGENIKLLNLLDKLKIETEVETPPNENVVTIVNLIIRAIALLRSCGYEPIIFLPPSGPRVIIAMYIAACTEKTLVIAPENVPETKEYKVGHFEFPLFPIVGLKDNEKFVLGKIQKLVKMEGGNVVRVKNLFKDITRSKEYNKLYSKTSLRTPRNEGVAARKQIQRIIEKLNDLNLINMERKGKLLFLKLTPFGELMIKNSLEDTI